MGIVRHTNFGSLSLWATVFAIADRRFCMLEVRYT